MADRVKVFRGIFFGGLAVLPFWGTVVWLLIK